MHVTLKVNTKVNTKPDTKVNTRVNPDGARLRIDAGLPNGFRLQSLPQRSDLIDLTPARTRGSHPTGPKLWNL